MKTIPSLLIQRDNNLSIIVIYEPDVNALMIGVKVKLIRARHVDEDVSDLKDNVISDGHGFPEEFKKLTCKCNVFDKDFHVLIYKEFRDGITPCTSLTTSDGLLLHNFTLKRINSTNGNAICTCPITLGHTK